jgi:hypothetical protein
MRDHIGRDAIAPSVATNQQHTFRKARTGGRSFFAPVSEDGPLETAYRELLDLRERVREAELAAAKSRGKSPSNRQRR